MIIDNWENLNQEIIDALNEKQTGGDLLDYIQENFIPKEVYEKKIELLSKSLLVIQNEHLREVETRRAFIDAHEKLREENERLKGKAVLNDAGEVLFISVADHKELMTMQRKNCNFAFLDNQLHGEKSDAILNAPEPTIEDLNKS